MLFKVVQKSGAFDISKAANIDWGNEEVPARMKEIQDYHDRIMKWSYEGGLDLHKLKDYHDWLVTVANGVQAEGDAMTRRFKLANAKIGKSRDVRRTNACVNTIDAIRQQERRHNNEIAMMKFEIDWLKSQPAWGEAMEFLKTHWTQTPSGWVSKKDMADDAGVSFEDMLAQMKDKTKEGPGFDGDWDGE